MELHQLFSEELVMVQLQSRTAEQAISKVTSLLSGAGYVDHGYIQSVVEREKRYPTGLPTKPLSVALAHGDPKLVDRSGIAVAILKDPVQFREMGTPDRLLDVKIVFVLAIRETGKQTNILKGLVDFLNDEAALQQLASAGTKREVIRLLCNSRSS